MNRFLSILSDILLLCGCVLIGVACFEIHQIVGLLYSGGLCVLFSVGIARLTPKEEKHDT